MTVCTGNICRSPMAEIVLRERLVAAGLSGGRVRVSSTGVSDEERGNRIDKRARSVLSEATYTDTALDHHRAKQVRASDLEEHDLILAMTATHARALRRLAPDSAVASRVLLYRSFDPDAPEVAPGDPGEDRLDIVDPWYGDKQDFVHCLAQIEAAADGIVEYLRNRLDNGH